MRERDEQGSDEFTGFGSPFADDAPTDDPAQSTEDRGGEDAGPDEWEPPSRDAWETAQRDLQRSQEAERSAAQRAEQNQQLLAQLLQGQGGGQGGHQLEQPAAEPLDLSGMPDPVTDREGYARWLGETLTKAERRALAKAQQATQQLTDAQRADRLFDGFCARNPGLRDKRAMVQAAAETAGLNGSEDPDVIFRRTEEVLANWGVPLESKQTVTRQSPARTGVGPASGERGRSRRPAEPDVDFVDAISDAQVKLGIM